MRLFTAFICLILSGLFASGQCIPDTNVTHNDVGIYPDSATGLPHALTGQPYSTEIQVKVGVDTTFTDPVSGLTLPATIDSIKILNVTGLPSGFTYSCTPSNCTFPGGSDACISLQGPSPTVNMVGFYPIVVQLRGFGKVFGTPQTINQNDSDYAITIDSTTGIGTIERNTFSIGQNQPNPAKSYTSIPVSFLRNEQITFTLSNLLGVKVITGNFSFQRGKSFIPVDLHGIQPGIYIYTVSNGRNSLTRRMIISNN
jgi:Secretion system C-terminal sorting domain